MNPIIDQVAWELYEYIRWQPFAEPIADASSSNHRAYMTTRSAGTDGRRRKSARMARTHRGTVILGPDGLEICRSHDGEK